MIAVFDASAAVRVVVDPVAELELGKVAREAELVLAPELLVAEVSNAFWKYLRAGRLTREQCQRGLRAAFDLVDEFMPLQPMATEAFDLAAVMGRPVYDAFYLVLARRNGAVLATADQRLQADAAVLGIQTPARHE